MAGTILSNVKRIPIFAMMFMYVFVGSSVILTIASLLCLVIWPFSKSLYRRIISLMFAVIIGQVSWLCHDWACMRVTLFGDREAYEHLGKESSLLLTNHRSDLDWMTGFVVGAHFKYIQGVRSFIKRSVLYVPGLGQLLWAMEVALLSRNYAKDRALIAKVSQAYKEFPIPIQMFVFCEGTRFTPAKHAESVRYAKEKGLKVLQHHLVPKTKGFALMAQHLKNCTKFTALHDLIIVYPGGDRLPTLSDIVFGKTIDVYWHLRRIGCIDEVPSTTEDIRTYIYNKYIEKDEIYDHYIRHGTFPGPVYPMPKSHTIWLLRANELLWIMLLVVIPVTQLPWLYLCLATCGCLVLMLILLWYSRNTQVKEH